MLPLTPRKTLLLLLAVAAVILAGGLRLARRQETIRIPRDREFIRRFEDSLQHEIQRLSHLYELDVRRVARQAERRNQFAAKEDCDRVVGIRQFSWIYGPARTKENLHMVIGSSGESRFAVPIIDGSIIPDASLQIRLPADLLWASPGDWGWFDEPGQPLFFWCNHPGNELAVLLIDPQAVGQAMDSWIAEWLRQSWPSPAQNGGFDRLYGSNGVALSPGDPTHFSLETADYLVPVQTRYGIWKLASWDSRELRVFYHTPTVAASVFLSGLVALIGMLVSLQQNRALRLAEKRVSFVNRVSHELRTPLTNILLNLDVTHDLIVDEVGGEAARGLAMASEEARRLGRLIANVLTFSQIERGSVKAYQRACTPAAIFAGLAEQFAPAFARRSLCLTLRNEASTPCLLDADAIAQIVGNLFSNVEKYVPGGAVEFASWQEDDWLVARVADHGPGIPQAQVDRVFLPFERLGNSVAEGASGAGLGLAIARDLANAMGGSLRILPSPKGALFELRVPAPPLSSPTAA